ncbi:uncharacterized protein N7482_000028 [Penicillium canariense]|uniref:Carboxymuconolactone decarboxylase-like domain-containing protein n=1 Tax=Penicillium canariense TaxID=189055 RepID=A0A9W9IEJ6_9EURO|nr:uncharacterized protein N7482_000028 [Penicillium canariense]KAJ5174151.1 hypothetical protein N7482_000028 [Penicillium canariense]
MSRLEFLQAFRDRENEPQIVKAKWYIVAATALTAACAGDQVPALYHLATEGLTIEERKIVQRRIKEAILKGGMLYGVPRLADALGPLGKVIPPDEMDHYGPRSERPRTKEEEEKRAARGKRYFETLWTPAVAQAESERVAASHPDNYLLSLKLHYEYWISEDAILGPIETQMCNAALLICNRSPVQAIWHTRGVVRHGGSMEQARFAQDLGLAVAEQFEVKTGDITIVDQIDF